MNCLPHSTPRPFPKHSVLRILAFGSVVSIAACGSAPAVFAQGKAPTPSRRVTFNRDIRPILAEKCFKCHGPDPKERKGKLRLDRFEDATAPAGSGDPAIVPGKLDEGELYPPNHVGGPRRADAAAQERQVALGRGGGADQDLDRSGGRVSRTLGFPATLRPELPAVKNRAGAEIPIDVFILARLEAEGLSPAPEADKVTMLRRLSLDLIGLPPAIDEVDAFRGRSRADAYDELVDRLLASPHYGERWGRIWLDAARYADSDGYEKDKSRQVYFYRDWVIGALNRDLPYNQFIIEQLAGDQLPGATQDQIVATGFLRNSMINEEGGVDPEQFRMEAMFDRMDCIGKGILGLTIQCAQCHSHKYDPLTQEEYYRMFAFLNNSHEANVAVYSPEEQKKRAEIVRKIQEIEELIQHQSPDWPARWPSGKSGSRAISPSGTSCGRRSTKNRPAARSTCPWMTAPSWRRDTRRPSTR